MNLNLKTIEKRAEKLLDPSTKGTRPSKPNETGQKDVKAEFVVAASEKNIESSADLNVEAKVDDNLTAAKKSINMVAKEVTVSTASK